MLNKLKNKAIIIFVFVSMLFMTLSMLLFTPAMADSTVTTFKMKGGASIRTQEPYGIRFFAELSATDYGTLDGQGAEFGMIVAPLDFITDGEGNVDYSDFKMDSTTLEKYDSSKTYTSSDKYFNWTTVEPALDTQDYDGDGDKTEYVIIASFVGIKPENISRPFAARAYYKVGSDYTETDTIADRSIYTVASKAMADGLIDSNNPEVSSYFNNIIDTVEASYTEISITLDGITDGKADVGNTFKVKATVSKPDGSKTLESGANVVITDKDGNETDAVSKNNDGSYTVDYIGNFKVSATLGDTTEEFDIENSTYNIFSTHDDIKGINNTNNDSNIKNYTGESNMQWTMMSSYVGHDNVLIWEQKTDSEITADNEHYGFTFAEDIRKQMRTDVYLYMDIYYVGTTTSTWFTVHGRTADERTYFSTGITGKLSDIRAFYTADGTRLSPSDNYSGIGPAQGGGTGEWLTLEYKLPSQWENNDYFSAYNSYNNRSYRGKMYFANIRLSTEKIETPTIEVENNYAFTSSYWSDASEIGGRNNVKSWTGLSSGDTQSVNAPTALKNAMKAGTYVYFDFYNTAQNGLTIALRHDGSTSTKWYPHQNNTDTDKILYGPSGSNDYFSVQLLRRSNGQYVNATDTINAYYNEWLTFEIYVKQDFKEGSATKYDFYLFKTWKAALSYIEPTVRVYDTKQTIPWEPQTVLEDPKAVDGQVLSNEQLAVVEVAKAYYRQRSYINYDQYNSRRNLIISPEEANSQRTVYLDCSSFVNNCYMEAFGAPIIPASYNLSAKTLDFAKYASENPTNADVVGHWVNADYTTPEAQAEILSSVRSMLEVGDILNYRHTSGDGAGHVYIYMGNDQFMHCHSGNSYLMNENNPSEAYDRGSDFKIINYISADSLFTDTTNNRYLFKDTANDKVENFSLLRPLARTEEMVITPETQGRMTIAGVTLDKTSSVGYNSAVCRGDEITYTITLKNNFAVSKSATLNDTLPEGVEFVSSDTVTCTDGVISWSGSVSGLGTTTLEYTVKVSDTATAGTLIVSDKTTINGVFLSTITNTVSGYTADKLTAVANEAKSATADGADDPLDIVKNIYSELDADFLNDYDSVQALLDDLIDSENNTKKTETEVSKMIAPNLFGGYSIRTGWTKDYQRTRLVAEANLAVGDVIVADWTDANNNSNSLIYVYVGDNTLISITSISDVIEVKTLTIGDDIWNAASKSESPNYLVSLISYNRFAVLRPSMVVNAAE